MISFHRQTFPSPTSVKIVIIHDLCLDPSAFCSSSIFIIVTHVTVVAVVILVAVITTKTLLSSAPIVVIYHYDCIGSESWYSFHLPISSQTRDCSTGVHRNGFRDKDTPAHCQF